jgi:hypothetical protein
MDERADHGGEVEHKVRQIARRLRAVRQITRDRNNELLLALRQMDRSHLLLGYLRGVPQ